ncbi:MAG: FKBP-type peptidyl-prolyl cis-trans isomerase [Muribaculum sp.]|nr:FKBP-type peptidyl-prolyl cis-trans isomerase [Muribaculaceae bacterium]MCM1081127.1 FKBP-type peptidyl-prolyl cis-trans isomerase [Muribaculum sp.]MCM1255885.1 FKBP-type peptidyl-prolyl cis-trans isomerase [Duncaniella sp.]
MKKSILAAGSALLLLSVVSCSKNASNVSPEDKAFDDSLACAWGQMAGMQSYQMVESNPNENINKDAYLRGVQTALMVDTADQSYLQGLALGVRLAQSRYYAMKQLGVNVNADLLLKNFRAYFMSDTVPQNAQDLMTGFQILAQRAEKRMQDRRDAELENSDESVANIKAGDAYVDSLKSAGAQLQTAESGLVYTIENPGEGEKVKDTDRVVVKYKGSFTDGKVFDNSEDHGGTATFSPTNVVAGFGEGLKMLGKGGKATLYIPGKLAYGVHGNPGAGIGPNQMLVFDVEVVDINPEK